MTESEEAEDSDEETRPEDEEPRLTEHEGIGLWDFPLFFGGVLMLVSAMLFSLFSLEVIFQCVSGLVSNSSTMCRPIPSFIGVFLLGFVLLVIGSFMSGRREPEFEYEHIELPTDHPLDELEAIRVEARGTVDNQIESIREDRHDFVSLLRINLLIASVTIAGLALLIGNSELSSFFRSTNLINSVTIAGATAWMLSTVSSIIGYISLTYSTNFSADVMEDVLTQRHTYQMFQEWIIRGYYDALLNNEDNQFKTSFFAGTAMILSTLSVILLIAGTILTL